jgi:hypothetical protein
MPVNPDPFTPQERDYLRTIMGYPILFSSANAVFENVLNSINGLYALDGGATQQSIRNSMAALQTLETTLSNLQNLMLATSVEDKIKVDAIRNDAYLRAVSGPALINQIAIRLSMFPAQAYFNSVPISPAGQAIIHKLDL